MTVQNLAAASHLWVATKFDADGLGVQLFYIWHLLMSLVLDNCPQFEELLQN